MSIDHHLDQLVAASAAIGSIPFDCSAPFTDALLDSDILRIRDAEAGERGLFEVADASSRSVNGPTSDAVKTGYHATGPRNVSGSRSASGPRSIRQASIGAITGLTSSSGYGDGFHHESNTDSHSNGDIDAILKAVTKLLDIYPMQECTSQLNGLYSRFQETRTKTQRLEQKIEKHRIEAQGADKENKRGYTTPPKAAMKHSRQSIRPPGARMSVAPGNLLINQKAGPVEALSSPVPNLAETIRKEEHDILALESMMAEKQHARDGLDEKIHNVEELEKEKKRARDAEIAKETLAKQEAENAQLHKGALEANHALEKEIEAMTRELQELEKAAGSGKNPIETSLHQLKSSVERSGSASSNPETKSVFDEITGLLTELAKSKESPELDAQASEEDDYNITRNLMQSILTTKIQPSEKTPPQTVLSAFLLATLLEAPSQSVPLAQLKAAVGQQAEDYASQVESADIKNGYTLDAGIKALYGLVANRMIMIDRSGREGIVKIVS